VAPITEEEIHNEVREVIQERQRIILKLKKEGQLKYQ
jgi:S-adenosylmethionine:tRNA-ribosyltransferase-isomerase (queuine synthetase)